MLRELAESHKTIPLLHGSYATKTDVTSPRPEASAAKATPTNVCVSDVAKATKIKLIKFSRLVVTIYKIK